MSQTEFLTCQLNICPIVAVFKSKSLIVLVVLQISNHVTSTPVYRNRLPDSKIMFVPNLMKTAVNEISEFETELQYVTHSYLNPI